MKKEFITVFTASAARRLLKQGYVIADIRPDKTDPDRKKSLFVFRNDYGLLDELRNIMAI